MSFTFSFIRFSSYFKHYFFLIGSLIVISVPLAYFSSIGLASKHGIVVKGTNYLDSLASSSKVVSDKTGTLTKGVFEINKVVAVNGSKEELMECLVAAEYLSNHPIAKAICKHQNVQNYADLTKNYEEFAGLGVSIEYKDAFILAGNANLLKSMQVEFDEAAKKLKVNFTNTSDGLVSYDQETNTFTVINEAGVALPQTGGIGTTLFTALGGLMTATAGAILTIRRKRKTA